MDSTTLATREIMWNIPPSYKYVMYGLFFVAVAIFIYGFYKKAVYVSGGSLKNLKNILPKKLNYKNFFDTIFFQGKILQSEKMF